MRPVRRHGFGVPEWEPKRRQLWSDLGRYRKEAKLQVGSKVYKTLMSLTSKEAGQRAEALRSIKRNLDEFGKHLKWMELALKDPNPEVRCCAVTIFGLALEHGGRGINPLPKLVFALEDPALNVRRAAVDKIDIYAGMMKMRGHSISAEAINALSKRLNDPDQEVKMSTALLFKKIECAGPLIHSDDPYFQRMGKKILEDQRKRR